jgi:flagellar hook-basal body complex protein FliE
VVEATLELETTLRIAVSMRDKFVQAYQEVLRMPI